MGDYDDAADDPQVRSRRRWWPLLAVVAALVVGVGLGYLWRSATEPVPVAAPPPPVAAPPTTPPAPAAPSPCVAVAQGGTDVLAQLDTAARAVGARDPAALRQVLDEVRRLRDQIQRDVDACRSAAGGGPAPVPPVPGPGG
jgi:hypothetical protein